MWKWLHPYAKHETQYHLCGKLSPFLVCDCGFIIGCWHRVGLSLRTG